MRLPRLAAAALSAALLVSACSSSTADLTAGDGPLAPAAALERASYSTQEARSARMELEITMTGVPDVGEVVFGGTGEFDHAEGEYAMVLDLSAFFEQAGAGGFGAFAIDDGEMEIRIVDETGYLRFSLFSMMTGGDSEWISFPLDELQDAGGMSPIPGGGNPAALMAVLSGGDRIETVGTESVRGVETTHYRGDFDPQAASKVDVPEEYAAEYDEALAALGDTPIPIDVWIDDDGLVRRMVMSIDGGLGALVPVEGAESSTMTFQIELFDFGADIDVEAPVGAVDAEEAGLSGALGGFGG